MTEEIKKSINILMVEDNPADALLTKETLSEREKAFYKVSTVDTGIKALSYLRNGRAPKPDLLLLDFSLPRMHGFDFLSEIKTDPELKTIPVCMLSTLVSEADIEKAKEKGAECHLIKPLDLEEFESISSRIMGDSSLL